MIEEAKCPDCGETFDVSYCGYDIELDGDFANVVHTMFCAKCGNTWSYREAYKLIEACNEK